MTTIDHMVLYETVGQLFGMPDQPTAPPVTLGQLVTFAAREIAPVVPDDICPFALAANEIILPALNDGSIAPVVSVN